MQRCDNDATGSEKSDGLHNMSCATTVSLLEQMLGTPQQCLAPASYDSSELQDLMSAICDMHGFFSEACPDMAGNPYAHCSAHDRANALTRASRETTGRCCNAVRVIYNSTGHKTLYVQCRGDAVGLAWMLAVGIALLFVPIIFFTTRAIRRRRRRAHRSKDATTFHGVAALPGPRAAASGAASGGGLSARSPGDRALANALLQQMASKTRSERRARVTKLIDTFGFQRDSAENQLRHFESLLLSHMSQEGDGDSERVRQTAPSNPQLIRRPVLPIVGAAHATSPDGARLGG